MTDTLTTREAAELLGVSVLRVSQLCERGQLKARKFGQLWAVDRQSVLDRIAADPKPGRPKNDP